MLMDNLKRMIDVEASETTNQEDYVREMKTILQSDGGVKSVNDLVAGAIGSID